MQAISGIRSERLLDYKYHVINAIHKDNCVGGS